MMLERDRMLALKTAVHRLIGECGGLEASASVCRVSMSVLSEYQSRNHPERMMPAGGCVMGGGERRLDGAMTSGGGGFSLPVGGDAGGAPPRSIPPDLFELPELTGILRAHASRSVGNEPRALLQLAGRARGDISRRAPSGRGLSLYRPAQGVGADAGLTCLDVSSSKLTGPACGSAAPARAFWGRA